jgi:hypothetical protein
VQLLKNLPTFYGTKRFIVMFTRALNWSYPEPDKSSPYHPILSKIQGHSGIGKYTTFASSFHICKAPEMSKHFLSLLLNAAVSIKTSVNNGPINKRKAAGGMRIRTDRETEVLRGHLPQCHFVHHKPHMTWPGTEPRPLMWKASSNNTHHCEKTQKKGKENPVQSGRTISFMYHQIMYSASQIFSFQ